MKNAVSVNATENLRTRQLISCELYKIYPLANSIFTIVHNISHLNARAMCKNRLLD